MRKIKVIGDFIQLYFGKVRLDEKQAKARAHGLKLVKDDIWEITAPIGFKRGEVFGYDGEIGKGQVEDVEEFRGPGRPAGSGGNQKGGSKAEEKDEES